MKGRDKRRRAKSKHEIPMDRLRRCTVLVSLIDETTCNAEQRFQKSQEKNGCAACQHNTTSHLASPPRVEG